MKSQELHTRIADALARIGMLARAHEQRESQASSLSPLQARALALLSRRSELRIGQLAAELLVTDGTVSAAIAALEQKGLVTRSPDPEEHRAVNVSLTKRGRHLARAADRWQAQLLEPVVATLDEEDGALLLASLLKLIRACELRGLISTTRMCFGCRYFRPGKGGPGRPHYCELLRSEIGNDKLRIDCPEHESADADRQEEIWRTLSSTS